MLLLTTTAEPVKKKNEKAVVLKSQVGRLVLSSGHEGFKQPNKTKPMKVFKVKQTPPPPSELMSFGQNTE